MVVLFYTRHISSKLGLLPGTQVRQSGGGRSELCTVEARMYIVLREQVYF